MSGLFRRARAYRTRIDLLGEAMGQDDFVLDIPADERRSVLSGIDSMLKDDRIRPDEGALRFEPRKKVFVLPLALNLGALILLAAGAFVLFRVFDKNEQDMMTSDGALSSAEGRILENMRRESEAELGAKDAEIAGIRARLDDLENQKGLLAVEIDAQIALREEQLRHEFEASLAAERARLSGEGITGEELSAALAAYEAEVRSELESDIVSAKQEADAEKARRIAELDAQKVVYQSQIQAMDAEKQRIQGELAQRDAEIQELEAQQEVQAAQSGEASRQLSDLRASREQEQLITDQIMAFYAQVGEARSSGNPEAALSSLNSLETYLSEPSIASSFAVTGRRDTDIFLIGALRRLINLENQSEPEAAVETVVAPDDEARRLLEALSAGALAGTRLSESGNTQGARQAWLDAFSAVPELEQAFEHAVEDAREDGRVAAAAGSGLAGTAAATAAQLAAARDEGIVEGLAQGRSAAQAEAQGDIEAARNEAYSAGRSEGLEEAAEALDELRNRLTALAARVEALKGRYSDALVSVQDGAGERQERLVDLLGSKLTLKHGLDESLHDDLDEYVDSATQHNAMEDRELIYSEIVEFLSALSSSLE